MKSLIIGLTILLSVSAFASDIECYHSVAKHPACGYYEVDEQMRSCRLDVYGRNADNRRVVHSFTADGRYAETNNSALKFIRVKKVERALMKKIRADIEELQTTIPACEF